MSQAAQQATSASETTKAIVNKKINELASLLHDEWRKSRELVNQTTKYDPRIKATKDHGWIAAKGTDQIDIANTEYKDLPSDWQYENKASAEVAIKLVHNQVIASEKTDEKFVETASAIIHIAWLERNGEWAPNEQKLPYEHLSEEEKEKDRVIIRKAIVLYEKTAS